MLIVIDVIMMALHIALDVMILLLINFLNLITRAAIVFNQFFFLNQILPFFKFNIYFYYKIK